LWFGFDIGSMYSSVYAGLGQQSGTFDIAQVQLEEGSVATEFEYRTYGEEMRLCQRYYQTTYPVGSPPGSITTTGMMQTFVQGACLYASLTFNLPVVMRENPICAVYSYSTGLWGCINADSGTVPAVVIVYGKNSICVQANNSLMSTNQAFQFHYTADAEI